VRGPIPGQARLTGTCQRLPGPLGLQRSRPPACRVGPGQLPPRGRRQEHRTSAACPGTPRCPGRPPETARRRAGRWHRARRFERHDARPYPRRQATPGRSAPRPRATMRPAEAHSQPQSVSPMRWSYGPRSPNPARLHLGSGGDRSRPPCSVAALSESGSRCPAVITPLRSPRSRCG
jgi:hypothetical protein